MKSNVKSDANKIIEEINKIIIGLEECSNEIIKIKGIGEQKSVDALDKVIREYKNLRNKLNNI